MGVPESQYKNKTDQIENPLKLKKQNTYSLNNGIKQNFQKIVEKYKTAVPTRHFNFNNNPINTKLSKNLKNTVEDTDLYQNSSTIKNFENSDSLFSNKESNTKEKKENIINDKKIIKSKNNIKKIKKPIEKGNLKYASKIKKNKTNLDIYENWDTDYKCDNITSLKNTNEYKEGKKIEFDSNIKNNEVQKTIYTNLKINDIINNEINENLLEKKNKNSEEDSQKNSCSNSENDNLSNNYDSKSSLSEEKRIVKMNNTDNYQSVTDSDYNSNDRLCPNANYRVGEKISDEYCSDSELCNKNDTNQRENESISENTKNKNIKETENNQKKTENNCDENSNIRRNIRRNNKEENNVNKENEVGGKEKINAIVKKEATKINNGNYGNNKEINKDQNNNIQNLNDNKFNDYENKKNEITIKKIINEKEYLNEYKNRCDSHKNNLKFISIEKMKNKKQILKNNNKTDQNITDKNQSDVNIINRNNSKNITQNVLSCKNTINNNINNGKIIKKDIFIKTVREIFNKIKNDNKNKLDLLKKKTVKNSFLAEKIINQKKNPSLRRKIQRSMLSNSLLKYIKTESNDSIYKNRNMHNDQKKGTLKVHKAKTTVKDDNDVIIFRNRRFNRTKNNSRRDNPFIHLDSNYKNRAKSSSKTKELCQDSSIKLNKINGKKMLNKNLTNLKTEIKNNIKIQKKFLKIDSERNPRLNKGNIKFNFNLPNNYSYQIYTNGNNRGTNKTINIYKKYSPENSTRHTEKYNTSSKSKNFRLVMYRNISFLENKNKQKEISQNYYKKLSSTITREKKFKTYVLKNIPLKTNVNNFINLEHKKDKISINKVEYFIKTVDPANENPRVSLKKNYIKISSIQKKTKNENRLNDIERSSNKMNIKVELPSNSGKSTSISQINQKLFYSCEKDKLHQSNNIIKYMSENRIIYDGILFRIIKKENKYKLISRYFQITKNRFKCFNRLSKLPNEKPLVQFDIRLIKNIEILNLNFIDSKLVKGYRIQFIFRIILKNKNESIIFATDEEKIGDDCVNILNLLIQFYKDENINLK